MRYVIWWMLSWNFLPVAFLPIDLFATPLRVGFGQAELTPPLGTPSAGFSERATTGMQGVHDPLLAMAVWIDDGEEQLVICSVDHLGFTHEMVRSITEKIHEQALLKNSKIFIASSHTHSGGGAYLNIPVIGEILAGKYDGEITQFYINQTVQAILQAYQNQTPAKLGVGYGHAECLSQYRGTWPQDLSPLHDVAIIKITRLDDTPLAVLFNYPIHPTVLNKKNLFFSADFVGYARQHLQAFLGEHVHPIYLNGAQGDIVPVPSFEKNLFDACDHLGKSLAETVQKIWKETETFDSVKIETKTHRYRFSTQVNPFGLGLGLEHYESELSVIVLNKTHAFVTIPGELSCFYDRRFKELGKEMGFTHVSVLGLTNDAHGYIISPDSWRHKTFESRLSFGGENYGEFVEKQVQQLLQALSPQKQYPTVFSD